MHQSKRTTPKPAAAKNNIELRVKHASELMQYLITALPDKSRNTIKSFLSHKMVLVNGKIITQFNHPLSPGDSLIIGKNEAKLVKQNQDIKILFEDDSLIVIDKPSGLLTIATDSEKHDTAYRRMSDHVKKSHPNNRIYILHRLDKDTSGVMMFAKNQKIQATMQSNWDEGVTKRQYQALVEGRVKEREGTLTSWLVEGKTGIVHVSKLPGKGQKAVTHYQINSCTNNYSLLTLSLETGRKNQIRVQLSDWGHPIAGDRKYGAQSNPLKRLALHALNLSFIHPITNKEMTFSSPLPVKFSLTLKHSK
jgi:23S rRNA pseudouridine1911/1915/1917 synthase